MKSAMAAYKGKILSTSEIEQILKTETDITLGSILPNDHSNVGNKSPCKCAGTSDRIFDRVYDSNGEMIRAYYLVV